MTQLEHDRRLIHQILQQQPEGAREILLAAWQRVEDDRLGWQQRIAAHLDANRHDLSPSDLRLHGLAG